MKNKVIAGVIAICLAVSSFSGAVQAAAPNAEYDGETQQQTPVENSLEEEDEKYQEEEEEPGQTMPAEEDADSPDNGEEDTSVDEPEDDRTHSGEEEENSQEKPDSQEGPVQNEVQEEKPDSQEKEETGQETDLAREPDSGTVTEETGQEAEEEKEDSSEVQSEKEQELVQDLVQGGRDPVEEEEPDKEDLISALSQELEEEVAETEELQEEEVTETEGLQEEEAYRGPGGYHQVPFDMPLVNENGGGIRAYRAGIPTRYDNRSKLPAVRNQEQYQTCWAFAAMAAAESGLIFKNKKVDGATVGSGIDLSEYQVAYFHYNNVDDPLQNTAGDSNIGIMYGRDIEGKEYLDLGGNNMFLTWSMAGWKAGADESAAPYSSVESTGGILNNTLAYQDKVHMQNAYWISMKQTNLVKQMIMEYGSVASGYAEGFPAFNDETNAYFSGTMSDNPLYQDYFGGHAIAIVGWDDNYSRENFNEECRPKKNGAWLIRNSWGDMRENGYFWMSYEEQTMDNMVMVFDFEDADNYDYNYQYDGSCGIGTLDKLQYSSVANVYEVKGADTQLLEAVSIGLASTDTSYSLQIYMDPEEGDPLSGTPMLSKPQKGEETFLGYHTIKLNESVELKKGHTFSVVFTFDSPAEVFAESTYQNGDWIRFVAETEEGQSFLVEPSGYVHDLHYANDSYCARIKAFTNAVTKKVTKASPGKNGSYAYYLDGQKVKSVTISAPAKVKLSYTQSPVTGSVNRPTVKGVYDKNGKLISADNYSVTYSNKNSKLPGSYKVTVKFKGSLYEGSLVQSYKLSIYPTETLKAAATRNTIKISWARNSKADGYYVYAATSKAGSYRKIATIKSNKTTSYTYKNLKGAKNYYFKIKSYKKVGSKTYTSAYSDILYGATKPGTVSNFKTTKQSTSAVKLSWKKVSGASGYQVYRYDASAKKWRKAASLNSKTFTYTDKKLKSGTTQKYRVRAYRKNGSYVAYGSFSGTVSVSTKPDQVTSLKAVAKGRENVKLSWKKVRGASGYQIYVYDKRQKKYVKTATVSNGSTVSRTLGSLKKNTTYQYKVRAYRKIGKTIYYGKYSDIKSVRTKK